MKKILFSFILFLFFALIFLFASTPISKSYAEIQCPADVPTDAKCPVCQSGYYYLSPGTSGSGCYPISGPGSVTNRCESVIDCSKTRLPSSKCVATNENRTSTSQNGCCTATECTTVEQGNTRTFKCDLCPAGSAWDGTSCYNNVTGNYEGILKDAVTCTDPPNTQCDVTTYTQGCVNEQPDPIDPHAGTQCFICSPGATWDGSKCSDDTDAITTYCSRGFNCIQGRGCWPGFTTRDPRTARCDDPATDRTNKCEVINVGGVRYIPTNIGGFVKTLLSIILSLSGGIAVILIIISGYKLMVSRGNPEQVQNAREQLTAAIVGLLFVIFSLVILQVIGLNILHIF